MSIRRILFQSIPVADQDRALAFYCDTLGFEVHTDAPYADGWRWIFLTLPGAETRLQFAQASQITHTDIPTLILEADDVDAEATRLAEAGVTITGGPDDAPWAKGVRWLMIKDTEDNLILLESLKEA